MSTPADVEITKAEAIAALRANAWAGADINTCGHRGCEEHRADGPLRIHSRAGGIGADWDLTGAIDAVEASTWVGWVGSFLGHHNLAVQAADGRVVCFEVPRP